MSDDFEQKVRRLSAGDIADIMTQYDTAMDSQHGSGEHFILIGLLSQKGFRVYSYQEALQVANRIIDVWYRLE